MPASNDPGLLMSMLQYLWAVLVVPLKMMWSRITHHEAAHDAALIAIKEAHDTTKSDLVAHKLHLAQNHFNKDEIISIVEKNMSPIHRGIDEMKDDIKMLVRREINKGDK